MKREKWIDQHDTKVTDVLHTTKISTVEVTVSSDK